MLDLGLLGSSDVVAAQGFAECPARSLLHPIQYTFGTEDLAACACRNPGRGGGRERERESEREQTKQIQVNPKP